MARGAADALPLSRSSAFSLAAISLDTPARWPASSSTFVIHPVSECPNAPIFAEIDAIACQRDGYSWARSAISQLRLPMTRDVPDNSAGKHKDETAPVYILSYSGTAVPASLGGRSQALAASLGISPVRAPVLAAT